MSNTFNYQRFHTEVEQLTQKANWYRQAGNRAAMMDLRRNPGVTLPKCDNGQYARHSFFYVFKYSFISRVTGIDTQKANEAINWLQVQLRHHNGNPPCTIEGKYGKTATSKKVENSTL